MSTNVTVTLAARRGRTRDVGATVAPGASEATASPPPERVPRVARVLALAHHWQGLIRSGTVRNQADLARLVGVSRARVTQVMRLLHLAPDIQEAVLDGAADGPRAEMALRKIADAVSWVEQRWNWARGPVAARLAPPRCRAGERARRPDGLRPSHSTSRNRRSCTSLRPRRSPA